MNRTSDLMWPEYVYVSQFHNNDDVSTVDVIQQEPRPEMTVAHELNHPPSALLSIRLVAGLHCLYKP
jgi:hypothetical protein